MSRGRALAAICFLCCLAGGCEDTPLSPREKQGPPRGTYIDEPIVLERSAPVEAVKLESGEYVFELGRVSLLRTSKRVDFEVTYFSPTRYDEDAWIYNYEAGEWTQIGFTPTGGSSWRTISVQFHLLSAKGLGVDECLNDRHEIRLKGNVANGGLMPRVEVLKINSDYLSFPLLDPRPVTVTGLAHDGSSLWAASWEDRRLYELSSSGEVIRRVDLDYKHVMVGPDPTGLAFDGEHLWLYDHWDRVSDGSLDRVTRDGELLCSLWAGQTFSAGLTWGAGTLWWARHGDPAGEVFTIDPFVTCPSGSWVVTDTITAPAKHIYGLAWDGSHLLVAGDSLHKVTDKGEVVDSYRLPVRPQHYGDMAWDGDGIWICNTGPKAVRGYDYVISRFRLR